MALHLSDSRAISPAPKTFQTSPRVYHSHISTVLGHRRPSNFLQAIFCNITTQNITSRTSAPVLRTIQAIWSRNAPSHDSTPITTRAWAPMPFLLKPNMTNADSSSKTRPTSPTTSSRNIGLFLRTDTSVLPRQMPRSLRGTCRHTSPSCIAIVHTRTIWGRL